MNSLLPADHPLRQAQWIWPDCSMYLHNHFAQFRWDFVLPAVSAQVPLFITADKSYRLHVNGVPVCRGPARGYQSHWPFDEVDLAGFLRSGSNWLSVEAYQPGCSTFQYLHENYAGLLVASGDPVLAEALQNSPPAMRRSPGHRRSTARYSMQIDFQEHLDLRVDDRRWIFDPEPPTGWVPDIFPPIAQKLHALPFGRYPYASVEPRGLPLLREFMSAPLPPTVTAAGTTHAGYETVENVSWHWIAEASNPVLEWEEAQRHIRVLEEDGFLTLRFPATGAGRFRAVVIPAKHYLLGTVEVTATGAKGGEILDFQHDQFFRDGRPHFVQPGDACMVALANRLILRSGSNFHEFYHPLGFGALTLIARDLTAPLTVRLRFRQMGYPFSMRGDFSCSEATLNQIHEACRRTQQLCSLDAYMDTPWREQAQWWGDACIQARNTFYLDGDTRLLARGIRSLAGQSVLGLTPGHAPTMSYGCVLPDFALTWILTLWDHYWQTGETDLFQEMLPRVKEVLGYFETAEARGTNGLLMNDKRLWLFEDWADLPKEGYPAFLNLWYGLALRHLAELCRLTGLDREGTEYREKGDSHLRLVENRFFDEESGYFHPALDLDEKRYGPPSVHDQTLGLMLNLQPQAQPGWLERFILPYLRGDTLPGAVPSAFWATYVIEQAIERGFAKEALDFIRRRWSPMLETGTTWEDFVWTEESGLSACHAWSSHPCYHFVNALAGIRQTAAGWKQISIVPCFQTDLSKVSALVPSPLGDIVSEWESCGGEVQGRVIIPEEINAVLVLPGRPNQPIKGDFRYSVTTGSRP